MPPAFVLSQDQTLHKNYFNNSRCQIFLRRIDLARFLCVIWTTFKFNVNCQVTSHYSIFKQLPLTQRPALSSAPLNSEPFCGVLFNISQVCVLSNFIFNFFQTFFISAQLWFAQRIAAWDLIYHSFEICQTCFQTFFESFFLSALSLNASCVLRHEV